MTVQELISANYKSRDFTNFSSDFVTGKYSIKELVEVATTELPHPYPEYASWLLIHIAKKSPLLIEPFQKELIDRILVSDNQSVLRNLTNCIVLLPLIEYKETELLDQLINFIKDDSNKVALFVYGIYKLIQFTKKYPEIKSEIVAIISMKQEPIQPAIRIGIRNYLKETRSINERI